MSNPFGSDLIAAGYSASRPPVHPRILERISSRLQWREPWRRALDVGCGAGVSTKALGGYAAHCVGLEPAQAMLKWARATAPSAEFAAGAAEAIPFLERTFDIVTAAGSLNYADLDLFFPEAARVLSPGGVLAVYDFGPGIRFREGTGLEDWFTRFSTRYPASAGEARELNPEILSELKSGFRVLHQERFEIGITLKPDFYVDYMMTETNVAESVQRGVSYADIAAWCAGTLDPIWRGGQREVLFRGYFVCMIPD
jgi:ubiquinone/menaquinone biosynthesis C-methylase UbiE